MEQAFLPKATKTKGGSMGGIGIGFNPAGEAVVVDHYYNYKGKERVKRQWLKPGVRIRALTKERKKT